MAKASNSLSKFALWVLLGLLIIALGGFGATNLSGTARTLGSVGEKYISIERFARDFQQDIRTISARTGEPMTAAQARDMGLDERTLTRLVRARALDNEAGLMGLSVGNEVIRDRILAIPSFQGLDGNFDREAYRFALSNSGTSEAEFEADLRDEVARTILQGALMSGVTMPGTFAQTLAAYVGETRDFTWARLDQTQLTEPRATPDDATLRTFYDENIDRFQLPESKRITAAVLFPDDLIDQIDVSEDDLKAAYDKRINEFVQPERRLVERLVYVDAAEAERAAAQLEVGGTTFETLVEERGLRLEDVDMGDVGRLELDAAGEAVFSAQVGDVVGPLPAPLGQALFRVNAVLPAQSTSLEEARDILQTDLARDRARRRVEAEGQNIEDLLAGGATLEEVVAETDMSLVTFDWWDGNGEGLGAYEAFRSAALELTEEDFPTILDLEDGGIFAMRLDDTLPVRAIPYEDALNSVKANYQADQTEAALRAMAEAALPALREGGEFSDQGFESSLELGLRRTDFIPGTPSTFLTDVFTMKPGDVEIMSFFGAVALVRLDAIHAAAQDDPDLREQTEALTEQAGLALAADMFEVFTDDVVIRARPQINQQLVEAVLAQMP